MVTSYLHVENGTQQKNSCVELLRSTRELSDKQVELIKKVVDIIFLQSNLDAIER